MNDDVFIILNMVAICAEIIDTPALTKCSPDLVLFARNTGNMAQQYLRNNGVVCNIMPEDIR